MNLRDLAILESASARLEELISACRVRGAIYGHDPALARDVTRKAKALRTSLIKLTQAANNPHHRPQKEEETVTKEPLVLRLYSTATYYELARIVSYGGMRPGDLRPHVEALKERHGESKLMWALHELTMTDERTGLTVLRTDARRACRVLLGPPPESDEYARYWQLQGCPPPECHKHPDERAKLDEPPGEQTKKPAKRARKKKG